MMELSSVSSSAMNFSTPRTLHMKPPTMVPDSTSIRLELFFRSFGIAVDSSTEARPTAKASTCRVRMEPPSKIAVAAPTLAPEETPRISGETRGFLNTL